MKAGITRAVWFKLARTAKLDECLIGPLQPGQREAERMMQPRVLRRHGDRRTQHAFSIAILSKLPIKISRVDCCRRVLRTETQPSPVFAFRVRQEATPGVKIPKRRARFRSIGVEPLRGDELRCCSLETFAVGGRLICSRNGGEKQGGPDADAAIGIGKQRRNERPKLRGRHALKDVEAPRRSIGSESDIAVRANSMLEGDTRDPSSVSAVARAIAGAPGYAATEASSAGASARPFHAA
jgi:hypothetical protein